MCSEEDGVDENEDNYEALSPVVHALKSIISVHQEAN